MATYEAFTARYPTSTATQTAVDALIPHASDLIAATILAPYNPADTTTALVISNAICDQVAAWLETGSSNDLAGYAPGISIKVDGLEVSGQPAAVSPRALRTLRAFGLLTPMGA